MAIKSTEELLKKIEEMKKKNKLDLSLDEDLSIAIMNLISIEEHLYFSGIKTNKRKFFDLLNPVREIRKKLLKQIVKEPEGEVWCLSKHMLAGTMRLIEVGNKHLAKNEKEKALDRFQDAFYLYSLFWSINLKLENEKLIDIEDKEWKEKLQLEKQNFEKSQISLKDKITDVVKKMIDCCKE